MPATAPSAEAAARRPRGATAADRRGHGRRLCLPPWSAVRELHEAAPEQKDYTLTRYYTPLVRHLFRQRLRIAHELLGDAVHGDILDVGFGAGVFLPELSRHSDRLYGVDLHPRIGQVRRYLGREGVRPLLAHASACDLPFGPACFDCVVCLSMLEFIEDVERPIAEAHRVLRPGGLLVAGVPVLGGPTDLLYRLVGLRNHREVHRTGHQRVEQALRALFAIEATRRIAAVPACGEGLYALWRARRGDP